MENIIIDKISGINFSFENEKFFIEIDSCSRSVGNLREEFKRRAIDLYQNNKHITLSLSSGIDSQAVLHTFIELGIDIEYAFLYFPGFNDNEYVNLKKLENKYNIKVNIVDIDPMACKEEILENYSNTGIPPGQILHQKFVEKLPIDADILQGIHGPDVAFNKQTQKYLILHSANSKEIFRLRSLMFLKNRTGKILAWERTSEMMFSLLNDDIFRAYISSYRYIFNHDIQYTNGNKIPIIDHWDLYIKPFVFGKYWGDELMYFPKFQAPEKIDYVMSKPYHQYKLNRIRIPLDDLLNVLKSQDKITKRFYEDQ